MSRRGNPYDSAKAESFMKTLRVEDPYLMEYETFEEVAVGACIQPWDISALSGSKTATPAPWSKTPPDPIHPKGALQGGVIGVNFA